MKKNNNGKLRIIPLGGLEQIGMNITAFEYEDSIVVVDCGLSFPEDDMLGIDLVIPDVTYLKDNIDKVKGFVITHGHEDHIGALPYVLREVNVPIYATKLTIGLIDNKLKEHNLLRSTKRKVIKHGQSINLGCFRIEFIKTNHSIQDASALAIYSPADNFFAVILNIQSSPDQNFPFYTGLSCFFYGCAGAGYHRNNLPRFGGNQVACRWFLLFFFIDVVIFLNFQNQSAAGNPGRYPGDIGKFCPQLLGNPGAVQVFFQNAVFYLKLF